ncbi:MAG: hypothetical protein AAB255_01495 [Bacteroidota bacterium]
MNNLPDTLTETIKDDNFQDVITDLGETAIDAILDEGVVRNIPLLGSFFGLAKATMSIQDKLFTKKILHFLVELKNTDPDSRKEQIEKIDTDPKYKTKVGEKLLYIIDKCEDSEKATYTGKLFQCYIDEKLDYKNFLRASKCIELTFLYDLKRFIKDKWDNMDMEEAGDLVGSGLMVAIYTPGGQTWDSLGGGTLKVKASPIGKLIQQLLDDK